VAELNGTAHTAEMKAGAESQFDVLIDDELAFSKEQAGRFPKLDEILALLA
jgi:hypothetical protein